MLIGQEKETRVRGVSSRSLKRVTGRKSASWCRTVPCLWQAIDKKQITIKRVVC